MISDDTIRQIISFFYTARKPLRSSNTKFTLFLGLFTGFVTAFTKSGTRLLGVSKNDAQVAYYGALTDKEASDYEAFDSTTVGHFLDSSDKKSKP